MNKEETFKASWAFPLIVCATESSYCVNSFQGIRNESQSF